MRTTTCTCCRAHRCVRVRSGDEITFDAALRRLRDKLVSECQPSQEEPSRGRPAGVLPPPWNMTRREFEAAAEPTIETAWGTPRFRGLSRAVLRRELHFLLRCPGSPAEGYRVRVPDGRADLYAEPHRAFVEAALADGLTLPPSVLSDYPELQNGRPPAAPPQLDSTSPAQR
jgi:hypothetical protein